MGALSLELNHLYCHFTSAISIKKEYRQEKDTYTTCTCMKLSASSPALILDHTIYLNFFYMIQGVPVHSQNIMSTWIDLGPYLRIPDVTPV